MSEKIQPNPQWNFLPEAKFSDFKPIRERLNCPWDYSKSREWNIENFRNKLREEMIKQGYDPKVLS